MSDPDGLLRAGIVPVSFLIFTAQQPEDAESGGRRNPIPGAAWRWWLGEEPGSPLPLVCAPGRWSLAGSS